MRTLAAFVLISPLLNLVVFADWNLYKTDQKLRFDSPANENTARRIFEKNLVNINNHNSKYDKGEVGFDMGITKFTHMTDKQLDSYRGYILPTDLKGVMTVNPSTTTTSSQSDILTSSDSCGADYRNSTCMLPVGDQGQCGCCYAFSAVHVLYYACCTQHNSFFINSTSSFSQQELIDCSSSFGNLGCSGGSMVRCYNYTMYRGIADIQSYPYYASQITCRSTKCYDLMSYSGCQITSIIRIEKDEAAIQAAIDTYGCLSAAIVTTNTSIFNYKSGVYNSPNCGNKVDHAVILCGYTPDYWIVKNSWGTSWGMQGYIHVNKSAPNWCGLGDMVSCVTVK